VTAATTSYAGAEQGALVIGVLDAPVFGRRNLIVASSLFLLGLIAILGLQARWHIGLGSVSSDSQFVYQAESLLHGHWDLNLPFRVTDIVIIHGKSYIVYPPFPAILLMPFVAIFGLATSDTLFTAVCSAINLGVLFLLLEQLRALGLTRRVWLEHVVISLLLWFGSINLWLSIGGRMWFTAHIVCLGCTLLALLLAFRRHYGWSAVLLGCAFFSRATVLVGFPLLLFMAWDDIGAQPTLRHFLTTVLARQPDWRAIPWRRLAPPLAVLAVVLFLFMLRNVLLFGSLLDSGYSILIQQRYPEVTQGPFNLSYVPSNVIANFFSFLRVLFSGPFDRAPRIDWLNGGYCVSVFVTTPLFLLLFQRNQRRPALRPLRVMLWVTLGLGVAAVLLFHAAGWYQFGARYLFDVYPFAFLLLALNDGHVDWRVAALGLLGVFINLQGAGQFWYP
jgi:hypothetical protein